MLAVDCGSVGVTAWRALRAAICAGVACFGAAAPSPQKPRALMISAGDCGFVAAGLVAAGLVAAGLVAAVSAGFGFAGCTICASADANWNADGARGLERDAASA